MMLCEHYLAHTDYPIWEVIQNGNGPVSITTDTSGQIKVLPPRTAEEIVARERERKARTTLLMAIPERYLAKCKSISEETVEVFSVPNTEGLHKGYDRFQSLLSQLEIHGAGVSTEDANKKFLRSLPSAWSQVSLIMRTKPGVSVFMNKESEIENQPLYDRFVTVEGMHAVPPPMTGNYMPSGTWNIEAKKRDGPREEEQVFMDELKDSEVRKREANEEAEAIWRRIPVSTLPSPKEGLSSFDQQIMRDDSEYLHLRIFINNSIMKIQEALEDKSWVDAMQEELLQFKIQKVWVLVDLPYGKKAIGTKWVYRNKKDERGVVVRNKARLVSGHSYPNGCGEVAFLYGKIDEEDELISWQCKKARPLWLLYYRSRIFCADVLEGRFNHIERVIEESYDSTDSTPDTTLYMEKSKSGMQEYHEIISFLKPKFDTSCFALMRLQLKPRRSNTCWIRSKKLKNKLKPVITTIEHGWKVFLEAKIDRKSQDSQNKGAQRVDEGRTRDIVDEDKEIEENVLSTEDVLSTDKDKYDRQIEGTDEQNEGTEEHIEGTEEHIEGYLKFSNCIPKGSFRKKGERCRIEDIEELTDLLESVKRWLGKYKMRGRQGLRQIDILLRKLQEKKESNLIEEKSKSSSRLNCCSKADSMLKQDRKSFRNRPPTKNHLRNQSHDLLDVCRILQHAKLTSRTLIKRMNEKGVDSSKDEMIKEESKEKVKEKSKAEVQEESKEEESKRNRKLGTRKKMKSRKRRYIQNTSEDDSDKENDELRLINIAR
ncbi:ribonuclease H-like domain-containing protein [Tanacetum coccineum]